MGDLPWNHKTPEGSVKIILLGDSAIGKTVRYFDCLCMSLLTNAFPGEYIPTIFDVTQLPALKYKDKSYDIELHDTVSRGDYDEIRPKQYPGTNLVIICFDIVGPASFNNVTMRWIPEVEQFAPNTPILLLGLKHDLRDDPRILERLKEKNQVQITTQVGQNLAKEIGAVGYLEYSSLNGYNREKVLDAIRKYSVQAHLGELVPPRPKGSNKVGKGCILS